MYQVSRWSAVSTQTVLIGWAVTVIFPMIWMIYSSFKTDQELFFSPWDAPVELQWDNLASAWTKAHVGDYLLNLSVIQISERTRRTTISYAVFCLKKKK